MPLVLPEAVETAADERALRWGRRLVLVLILSSPLYIFHLVVIPLWAATTMSPGNRFTAGEGLFAAGYLFTALAAGRLLWTGWKLDAFVRARVVPPRPFALAAARAAAAYALPLLVFAALTFLGIKDSAYGMFFARALAAIPTLVAAPSLLALFCNCHLLLNCPRQA